MSRNRSWWNGVIRSVGFSPWQPEPGAGLTVSMAVEVVSGAGSPEQQVGRLVQVELTPVRARQIADKLYEFAAKTEEAIDAAIADLDRRR